MTLFEVFDWLELTSLGAAVRGSTWLFPVIEAGHLLGLAALGAAVLVVDLRLLGFGLRERPASYSLDQARPWLAGALALLFATGVPLLLSEALKCYFSPAFWVKMGALATALSFTFAVRNRLVSRDPQLAGWRARGLGGASIVLWTTVAAAGRWIGFS